MPTESFENTNFDAMNGFEVTVMKFIQWYRESAGVGGAGVPVSPAGSFPIPPYDTQEFTYVAGGAADDDDIQTITYKKDGVVVATLTFTYYLNTNNVQSIIQT